MTTIATHWRFVSLLVLVIASFVARPVLAGSSDEPFHYSGDNGPAFWSELDPEWEVCAGTATSARQSPINITRVRFDKTLGPLELQIHPTHIDIFNNGHTIEQHYEGTGSFMAFEGMYYELLQFHFHSLSEHAVRGRMGVLELHAVFREPGAGSYLVVGVLYEVGHKRNRFIQSLIDAGLPEKTGDMTETEDEINLADAFTTTRRYYTYPGSLTTPPCSETVTWVVLARAATLAPTQLRSFRRILGNNFRPLQAINGRTVRASTGMHGRRW